MTADIATTRASKSWLTLSGLILLSLIPMLAGAVRAQRTIP